MIQPKESPPETLSDALVLLEEKQEIIAEQAATLQQFRFELDQLKKLIYGSRHERFVAGENPEQLALELGEDSSLAVPVAPSRSPIPASKLMSRKKGSPPVCRCLHIYPARKIY